MLSPRDAAVDLLADLVRIDSVNPTLVPGAAGEDEITRSLEARLDAAGCETTVLDAQGQEGRPSLIAVAPGDDDRPAVVLNGHTDTVGVSGMDNPFHPRVEGDRLYGRGAADMKGGVAGIVAAAEALAGSPHVRPVLALVSDEEDASVGTEAVIAALPDLGLQPILCLIAEPTHNALCRTLRGFALVRLTFHGRSAHSSQAALGVNAIYQMAELVTRVHSKALEIRAAGGDLMVTMASGGESAFVIPARAECVVETRNHPDQSDLDLVELVRSLLDADWDVEVTPVARREPWRVDADGPAAELSRRLSLELGTGTDFDAPYWMEAPLWQEVCPTVICGPSGGGMHAIDEWVHLGQVRAFTDGLVSVLGEWGADSH